MNLIASIPVYNSAATLPQAIAAVRAQTIAPRRMIIVDDGSTDGSASWATDAGVSVVALGANLGRGAARARALAEADADLLFMCDATLRPTPDFIANALPWFDDPLAGAVFGHVTQSAARTVAERWRGRHLFKTEPPSAPRTDALLATGVCVLRVEAARAVGGFNAALRAGEDADLGRRLLAAGWKVVADPALRAHSLRSDSAGETLERYARWNSPDGLRGRAWLRQLAYAVKVMALDDLRAHDPLAAFLSLAAPFHQLRRR
jgi:GT2 family glycosyltransferase